MTQKLKYAGPYGPRKSRRSTSVGIGFVMAPPLHKSRFEIKQEILEDAYLNAIADERADGPFVKVSLDDL